MRISIVQYRFSILLMALLIPSAFYGFTWLALVIVFWGWLSFKDYRNLKLGIYKPQIILPVCAYLYIIVGFFFSEDKGAALSSFSKMLPLLVFPIILCTTSGLDKIFLRKVLYLFIASIGVFMLIAIIYAVINVQASGNAFYMEDESIYSKYSSYGLTRVYRNWHPTYVSMFVNIAIAAILHLLFDQQSWFRKKLVVLTISILLFFGLCIVLLNAIIGFVSLLLIGIYFTIRYLNHHKTKPILQIAIAVLPFLVGAILFFFNPVGSEKIERLKNTSWKATDNQSERSVLTMRMAKWETHWAIFKKQPYFGTTIADIKTARLKAYQQKGYTDLAKYNYNAHNQYLEWLTNFGLLGSLVFFGIIMTPMLFLKKYHAFIIPFMIIVLITFLTESVLNRQQGMLCFMFFYSLYTNIHWENQLSEK